MEWVETTGRTLEEAKERALDQLGVDESDAEFDVLEEPRPGLFGRTRGEARVRARVRPTHPRPKLERRDRRRKAEGRPEGRPDGSAADAEGADATVAIAADAPVESVPSRPRSSRTKDAGGATTGKGRGARRAPEVTNDERGADMGQDEDEAAGVAAEAAHSAPSGGVPRPSNAEELGAIGEVGATFLRGLLAAMGLQGTVAVSVSDAELDVTIEGDDLGVLVGPRGQTLASLQEITRIAVQQQTGGAHGRLRVDVGGYWEKRRAALGRFARQVAADVEKTGRSKLLEPMNAADRKVVHDAVSDMAVVTRSQGEDPHRRVLIAPAD